MTTKRFGFTLAEVLITLGIIGVVAAMTIPTLISNTNSAKFKSQYKKTLSTMNQAALMATAQYDLDFASLTASCGTTGGTEKPDVTASMCALINGTLSGATYYSAASSIKIPGSTAAYAINGSPKVAAATFKAYQLADGSMVAFNDVTSCTLEVGGDITSLPTRCRGFIDVNGATLPNKEVSCSTAATTAIASTVGSSCIVRNNATDMGDIFPVVFHDGTVEPITNAARYVLNQAK